MPPGMRLAVAVSGGADSVALLRALAEAGAPRGLVLSVAHVHHGIRGADADGDLRFVAELASRLGLRFLEHRVDTPAVARQQKAGIEETARELRYGWFAELLTSGAVDAVATAHTLDDQAETVLARLMRGAWTEGLGGIHPVILPGAALRDPRDPSENEGSGPAAQLTRGEILRPLLGATRAQIVAWLQSIGQEWREDATNAELRYTRNRIRAQLLPELATYNPQIATQLSQMATIARDEEAYWQREVDRLLPALLLPGRAVRGGGRASSTLPGERSLALEVDRLRSLEPALARRLLRGMARELGVALDFEQTTRLVVLAESRGTANPRREELTAELRAERTPRELRLLLHARTEGTPAAVKASAAVIEVPVPGEAEGFGWRVRCSLATGNALPAEAARLRAALAGDRVQLRYSRGAPKRVKEVLERMGVPAEDRASWPLVEWQGEIVWLRGAVLEPTALSKLLSIEAEPA